MNRAVGLLLLLSACADSYVRDTADGAIPDDLASTRPSDAGDDWDTVVRAAELADAGELELRGDLAVQCLSLTRARCPNCRRFFGRPPPRSASVCSRQRALPCDLTTPAKSTRSAVWSSTPTESSTGVSSDVVLRGPPQALCLRTLAFSRSAAWCWHSVRRSSCVRSSRWTTRGWKAKLAESTPRYAKSNGCGSSATAENHRDIDHLIRRRCRLATGSGSGISA